MSGWIGVDFDGTLAEYGTWVSGSHCGKPIGAMLFRVKKWLAEGREVRIFTARIHPLDRCVMPPDILPPAFEHDGIVSREEVAIMAVAAISGGVQLCAQQRQQDA